MSYSKRVVLAYIVRMTFGVKGMGGYRQDGGFETSVRKISKFTGVGFDTVKEILEFFRKEGYIYYYELNGKPCKENDWSTMSVELLIDKLREDGDKIKPVKKR